MGLKKSLEIVSRTHPGLVRNFNEDSIVTDPNLGLTILADGMGGYRAGDVASEMATGIIHQELKLAWGQLKNDHIARANGFSAQSEAIRQAVDKANFTIYRSAHADTKYQGMGTTLALAYFYENHILVAHSGDSRIYRFRNGRMKQMTQDHSVLQEQVELGMISQEDARRSHNRNLVTRALGVDAALQLDMREEGTLPGDIYLLCSDGLNDAVEDSNIELALNELQANLQLTADILVQMANDNGGHDNVSVILIKVLRPFSEGQNWWRRLLSRWA